MAAVAVNDEEILKYAVSEGIISLDDVRKSMDLKERKRLLKQHHNKIFKGSDGRWKTTLPGANGTKTRKIIAKKTKEEVEDVVIQYYSGLEDHAYVEENIPTVTELYRRWLSYKMAHTESTAYIKRINSDWKRFYENDPIAEKEITALTEVYLDEWLHQKIKDYGLTKTSFYNMSTIVRQSLVYGCKDGVNLLEKNPMANIEINTKLFRRKQKPAATTQVYLNSEQKLIADECLRKISRNPNCTTPMAIMLNFQIGLRIGELVALKWSDIEGNYIHINRMEVEDYEIDNKTGVKIGFKGHKVVEHVKSGAGVREVYLNTEAQKILKMIKESSVQSGYYDQDYIFISSQKKVRSTARTITSYLEKLCATVGIAVKSNHKIRKTYISALFDAKINIDTIRRMAGHEDERTSLKNYCFDQNDKIYIEDQLENARNTTISC